MKLLDLFRKTPPVTVVPQRYTPPRQSFKQAWQASAINRLTQSWYVQLQSPSKEMQYDILRLRGISRYLSRNDVYTARYAELLQVHVVGSNGVQLTARVNGPDGNANAEVNEEIIEKWDDWKWNYASLDGQMSFLDIEQLIIKTVAIDGEIFVRLVTSPSLPMGFALELIDADRLDLNFNTAMDSRTNTFVVQGIEMDKFGKPVAYHFWSAHPDDAGVRPIERTRILASDILHLYRPDRPGRVRGIPWTAPSMYFLARLHEYMDAELVAAQAGASQLATIEQPMGDSSAYMNQTADVTAETIDLPQGVMIRLAPGEKMNPWVSNKPNTAFNPFIKTILHGIASALNVSYSSLASDTSEENYASGRLGILLEREYFKTIQSWLIRNLHQKIYPIWLDCAMSTGTITLPTDNVDDYDEVMWRGRRWAWADPAKEAKAFEGLIAMNLMSKTAVVAEQGLDYIDVLGERFEEEKREREYAKELVEMGLPPIAPAVAPVAPIVEDDVPVKPDTETEDTQDEQT